jgi:hypothetical protein
MRGYEKGEEVQGMDAGPSAANVNSWQPVNPKCVPIQSGQPKSNGNIS